MPTERYIYINNKKIILFCCIVRNTLWSIMDICSIFYAYRFVVFRLDTTFMGLTVLGIGNALPDALTTIALAKKGYA